MATVCLYFHAHQPNRLREYTFFDIGNNHFYEDDDFNASFLSEVSDKCYLPTNKVLLDLIKAYPDTFKVSFSISGVLIEQMEQHRPDVLDSFKELAATGNVEFVAETFYNSLSYEYSPKEFERQVKSHIERIEWQFSQTPKVFRNTGLVYYNELTKFIETMGFEGVLAPNAHWLLNWRSPNHIYKAPNVDNIKTLVQHEKLSLDLTKHFLDPSWSEYPLTATKFSDWLLNSEGDTVNLFMDYEVFGDHNSIETGILDLLKNFPRQFIEGGGSFKTPSETIAAYQEVGTYDAHDPISWSKIEHSLSPWTGTAMQYQAVSKIYSLEEKVLATKDLNLIHTWSKLQTSDNFFYMGPRAHEEHGSSYMSPYDSAYSGYIYFMNALSDLEISCDRILGNIPLHEDTTSTENEVKIPEVQLDDLKLIKGIGKRFEELLHAIGITTYDQVKSMNTVPLDGLDQETRNMIKRAIKEKWNNRVDAVLAQ